jgi:hypothetical protein
MHKIKDLLGKKFGEWTVIEFSHMKSHTAFWKCKCSCGTIKAVKGSSLTNGTSVSCHGLKKEITWDVDENGCWNCTSHKPNGGGYPRGSASNYKNILINRIMYEREYGKIQGGLFVLHKCDNRMCINPEHLFLGTNLDNIHDMYNKGRNKFLFGEDSPMAKLTEKQAIEIKESKGLSQRELAAKYNISRSQIKAIRAGTRWTHL